MILINLRKFTEFNRIQDLVSCQKCRVLAAGMARIDITIRILNKILMNISQKPGFGITYATLRKHLMLIFVAMSIAKNSAKNLRIPTKSFMFGVRSRIKNGSYLLLVCTNLPNHVIKQLIQLIKNGPASNTQQYHLLTENNLYRRLSQQNDNKINQKYECAKNQQQIYIRNSLRF